ncbi:acylpyruvase FAHD1, mitochondrial-like [Mytilus californianus]|uniref:acylpyruvase FAHD1, mitochondrial-like n=1 Tax=Mytilus californianus TaxID=6549 RepID=UPI002245D2E6|nr:acylpyruvase FAHD1, mitochondrial-like [Mytilus californianus]
MTERLKHFREIGKKVVAVCRNYKGLTAAQGIPNPKTPSLFAKPTTAYITEGQSICIPEGCNLLFHEVELGVVIKQKCSNVAVSDVDDYIGGFVLALDMTAKDFHNDAKANSRPWFLSKGFDTSCPVSDFIEREKVPNYQDLRLWLKVDGVIKQDDSTSDMIFSVPEVISYISKYITLEEGDVVLTGTPDGQGPVTEGQIMEAGLADIVSMKFSVAK